MGQKLFLELGLQQWTRQSSCPHEFYVLVRETNHKQTRKCNIIMLVWRKIKHLIRGWGVLGVGWAVIISGKASVIRWHLNRNLNEMRKKATVSFWARAFQTEVEVETVCSRNSKEVYVTGEERGSGGGWQRCSRGTKVLDQPGICRFLLLLEWEEKPLGG